VLAMSGQRRGLFSRNLRTDACNVALLQGVEARCLLGLAWKGHEIFCVSRASAPPFPSAVRPEEPGAAEVQTTAGRWYPCVYLLRIPGRRILGIPKLGFRVWWK